MDYGVGLMSEKIDELRKRLQRHGYQLYKIKHFKKHDRITFGNKNIKISINLRSKMSEVRFWEFPFQYRVKKYGGWTYKVEKWFLGLKMVAWNVECILYE